LTKNEVPKNIKMSESTFYAQLMAAQQAAQQEVARQAAEKERIQNTITAAHRAVMKKVVDGATSDAQHRNVIAIATTGSATARSCIIYFGHDLSDLRDLSLSTYKQCITDIKVAILHHYGPGFEVECSDGCYRASERGNSVQFSLRW